MFNTDENKTKVNLILPPGHRFYNHNGEIIFIYQRYAGSNKPMTFMITKSMFNDMAGQIGYPPLIKVDTISVGQSYIKVIIFKHLYFNNTGDLTILRSGILYLDQTFESIKWDIKTTNTVHSDLNQRLIELALKWIDIKESEGFYVMFPQDETMSSQIYSMKVSTKAPSSERTQLVQSLNNNYRKADALSMEALAKIIQDSETTYCNLIDEPENMLDDSVYDYIKDLYRVKLAEQNKLDIEAEISGRNDMAHVPTPVGRMVQLPIWLGSMTKINHGSGQLPLWSSNYPGPYIISDKEDGASALWFRENGVLKMYSRGRDGKAQDISEVLSYLKLPDLDLNVMIRGELIIKKSVFESKYKRSALIEGGLNEKGKYRNPRNMIGGGLVNKIGCRAAGSKGSGDILDIPFIEDVKFIMYEVITNPPMKCSDQFSYLESKYAKSSGESHCLVVPHNVLNHIDDQILSALYDKRLAESEFEIDGLIVCSDHVYQRPNDSNPPYARAYKKPLANLTKVTKINSVEWNVSKDGYWKPTIILDPVEIDGSTISAATGNNAKWVLDNKWFPGAKVEVIRSGGVIPKIIKVLNPGTEMSWPPGKTIWTSSGVDLMYDTSISNPEAEKSQTLKKLIYFLKKIGVKGIGPETVSSLYEIGVRLPEHFFMLKVEQVNFLGPVAGPNVIKAIHNRIGKISLPIMAAASGVFGRGVGSTLFKILFNTYPEFIQMWLNARADPKNTLDGIKEMAYQAISALPDFGPERAKIVSEGFESFIDFLKRMAAAGYPVVIKHQITTVNKPIEANHPLTGIKITLTGFHRDEDINKLLDDVGAIVQTMKSDTQMLIIRDESYRNKKTETAEAKGIQVISAADFKQKYIKK